MWRIFGLILLVILISTLGFRIIEGWSFLDCLYMTIITIFTVGFGEVKELSPQGQIFTIFVILSGVGTAIYAFTKLADALYEGGIRKFLWRKRMERKLQNLKDHYIICGHGRMGRVVRERLEEEKTPFIIIDNREEKLEELKESKTCLFIEGDATSEEVLIQAGIKKAKGLAALLPDDADNLYLVLTVRLINPSIFILSKAIDEEGERKILQIGANRVVSPYKLTGLKIAQGLMRPTLVDFFDLIIRRKEIALSIEEFIVKKESPISNRSLNECGIRKKANVIVVALKKPGEELVFNPPPDLKIGTGDTLLVLGDNKAIGLFESIFL